MNDLKRCGAAVPAVPTDSPADGPTTDDAEGFLMKAEPGKQPIAGGGGSGAPISLLFEWMANPAGTFVKGYSAAWFD